MSQFSDICEAERCRAAFDGVGTSEHRVQLFVVRRFQVQIQEHLFHLIEVLSRFFEKYLVELRKIN